MRTTASLTQENLKTKCCPSFFPSKPERTKTYKTFAISTPVVESEKAACGILITRYEPTAPMITFAKQEGKFKPDMIQPFDKLQIVTIQQILDGTRTNLAFVEQVTKKAQKAKKDDQPTFLSE